MQSGAGKFDSRVVDQCALLPSGWVLHCYYEAAPIDHVRRAVVLVNKAAPAGQLGAVNGAGQMLASAVRGAGPALCGVLWAASLGMRVPWHQFLPFALVSAGFGGIFAWYHLQRAAIERLTR